MKANDLFKKQAGNMTSIGRLSINNEVSHFGESIDYNQDGVCLTRCLWQPEDKVKAQVFPNSFRDRERSIKTSILGLTLGSLANGTMLNKSADIFAHMGPKEILS